MTQSSIMCMFDFFFFTNSYPKLVQKLDLNYRKINFSSTFYLTATSIDQFKKHVHKCLSLKKQWLWSMKCQVAIIIVHTHKKYTSIFYSNQAD